MPSVAGSYGSYKTFDQRWRKPGDEENTWVPKPLHGSFNYTFQNVVDGSDKQLEKGNMIRLKSVGLAYDFKPVGENRCVVGLVFEILRGKSLVLGKQPGRPGCRPFI